MNIVYLGSGEFGVPCLDALVGSRHRLALVGTQPPSGAGRGRKLCSTAVAHWAETHAVPYVEIGSVNSPEAVRQIADCRPDVLLVIMLNIVVDHALKNLELLVDQVLKLLVLFLVVLVQPLVLI